jgi:ABC-type nitrate/sulfonate/bicarbonate transport system substrate-binding protein
MLRISKRGNVKAAKRLFGATLATIVAVGLAGIGSSAAEDSAGKAKPTLLVSYFTNSLYASIIASQSSLLDSIPADVKFLLVQSGTAALAGIKSGSYEMTTQTGNPPITGAIALGTTADVVYAEAYDNASLVVNSSIKTPKDMIGKQFGVVFGGSGNFEFDSWLALNDLTGKVTLINLNYQGMVAAFKTGAIAGAYNNAPYTDVMIKDGGHSVVTAKEIATLGYPGINMMTVERSYAKKHPDVVQAYVCAEMAAYKLLTGPQREDVITKAVAFLGLEPAVGRKFAEDYPLFTPAEEVTKTALGASGDLKNGAVAQSLYLTGAYLEGKGLIKRAPSMEEVVSHIDPQFAIAAAGAACSK